MSNGYPPPGGQGWPPPQPGFPPFMPPGGFPPGMPMPTLPPGASFPPFPPPGMAMPNFPPQGMPPPTLPPQQGMNSPFPPGGPPGFRPPPQGISPNNMPSPSPSAPTPFRPPGMSPSNPGGPPSGPGQSMYPSRNTQGLGYGGGNNGPGGPPPMHIDHRAAGLPSAPRFVGGKENPNLIAPPVKTMKVFVGGIAAGVTDSMLTGLFNTCGPLYKLNRVTGPSGKPQAFGFAEFDNPDVLLRAVKCLNGVTLPDMTPQGRSSGASKTLVIKPDQKENAFLEDYQSTLMRTDSDEKQDEEAKERIQTIVKAMHDPRADLQSLLPSLAMPGSSGEDGPPEPAPPSNDPYEIPAHLKDLDETELPEDHRGVVLDQISMFRDQAIKREKAKKQAEEERERRASASSSNVGGAQRGQQMRQWGRDAGPSRQDRPIGDGPQSYNTPVGFVRAQAAESKALEGRTDEEEEELRLKEIARRKERQLSDRLRHLENQEWNLHSRLSKEADNTARDSEIEDENRSRMRKDLANWDDDRLAASGREIFFADRGRWRHQRASRRIPEYKADVADRQREAQEQTRADREADELMQQQMREMEEMEEKNRAAGHLLKASIPLKLAPAAAAPVVKAEPSKPKPAVPFGGDDDEEEAKRKRKVIKLDEDDGLTAEERAAVKRAKLAGIKEAVPTSKDELWKLKLRWEGISEATINTKIKTFVKDKMTEYLGELDDDDLVDFVVQHVKDRSAPDAIVEGVEMVLDEDAESFTISLWRLLAFESAAYAAGLDTGSETI